VIAMTLRAVLAGLALLLGSAIPGALAYHTNFQGSCTNDNFATSGVTRAQAQVYAEIGANEGYQWGGGCWNDNNHDEIKVLQDAVYLDLSVPGGEGVGEDLRTLAQTAVNKLD